MASEGYPGKYETGFEITEKVGLDALVYYAGAKIKDGKTVTGGGRVLGVTATADSLENAISKAYTNVPYISFQNAFYRKDIGKRALDALKGE